MRAVLAVAVALLVLFPTHGVSAEGPPGDSEPSAEASPGGGGSAEGGLELPLLEEAKPKKKKVKKKKTAKKTRKSRYPYDKFEIEFGYRYGWDSNVFDSADIDIPERQEVLEPQADEFQRPSLDFSWDRYLSKTDKFSLDYDYYGKFYEDLPLGDLEKHALRLEWRHRLRKNEYITAGFREWRKYNAGTDRWGNHLSSDLDYYRTDLYLQYQVDPFPNHTLELEYRLVNKDYDETQDPTDQSLDYQEHRFRVELERRFPQDIKGFLWLEERWRDYEEKYARDDMGTKVTGVTRDQERELAGVRLESALSQCLDAGVEIEYDRLTDLYRGYYSYEGINYRGDIEWKINPRLTLELEGKLYDRDYGERRFLASRLPAPGYSSKHLDPLITYYEDYRFKVELTYACTDRLDLTGSFYHRWYHVNDPTEEYRETQIYLGMVYYLKWRNPPRK
jgi:hypothetical protein